MEQAVFSAIHVSDFHFGADTNQVNILSVQNHRRAHGGFRGLRRSLAGPHRQTVHDPDIALAAAEFILETFPPGSLMLMSGDVAATGTDADLRVGAEFLYGTPLAMVPSLATSGRPTVAAAGHEVCLVPGNHDRYLGDLGSPGSVRFDHYFASHWERDVPVRVTVVQDVESETKLAVVAADMCLPRGFAGGVLNLRRYGHGLATQETVDLMRRRTDDVRDRQRDVGVCWMLHFPPTLNPNDVDDDLSLIDGHRVEGAARSLGIELIIAGHVHRSDVFARGRLQVVCAGSATCSLEAYGNYIHYLEITVSSSGVASLSDRRDFRWSRVRGAFLPHP